MSSSDTSIIQDILNSIGTWLANVVATVGDYIYNAFEPIIASIVSWADNVFSKLSNIASQITTAISNIWSNIAGYVSDIYESAVGYFDSIYNSIVNSIKSTFSDVADFFYDIYNSVTDGLSTIADGVATFISDAFDYVTTQIGNIIDNVVTYVSQLFDDVKFAISDVIDAAALTVNAIVDAVQTFVSEVVDTVGGSLRSLLETIAELPEELSALATLIQDTLTEYIGEPIKAIPEKLWSELTSVLANSSEGDRQRLVELMHNTMFSPNSPPKTREEAREFFDVAMPQGPVSNWISNMAILILTVFAQGNALASGQMELLVQESFYNAPGKILDPFELVTTYHYGINTRDDVIERLRYHGYDATAANKLIDINTRTAPEGELIAWKLRGFITEETLRTELNKKGYSQSSIDNLVKAAYFIPPVQDLITMAVREVFSPETAERFGQFEDFPAKFKEYAEQQGVSEEWARNYWAAHWALPSVQMGWEMLHRGVIEKADLELLLKAQDVMPFWRDKLTAISYNPYTRVDIRRMHAVGVLSDEDVYLAYRDLGYDHDKATKLQEFTVTLNEPEPEEDPETINKLTRASIINFYRDGILERTEAYQLLLDLGNSEAAADLYIRQADLDEELEERRAETDIIILKFQSGELDDKTATRQLEQLGLETRELYKALTKIRRFVESNIKIPSLSDLSKFYKAQIIDRAEYLRMLQVHGYSEQWAERYAQLLEKA